MCKGHLQTVLKAQYYHLKAQDNGTTTITSAAPIASSSTSAGTSGMDMSVEPTREQSQSIQRNVMGMDLDQSTPEDESPIQLYNDNDLYWQGNYADDFPDLPAGYETQPATPSLPDDPLQHEEPPIPPPESHPGDKDQPTPEPHLPAAHEDQCDSLAGTSLA
ncbi:hypothetical protein BDR04DRAFT_1162915 [Suillus decipiens]|nr:hypothetical protein BDR04DRAFT_1162915 [Suillus decipiens]